MSPEESEGMLTFIVLICAIAFAWGASNETRRGREQRAEKRRQLGIGSWWVIPGYDLPGQIIQEDIRDSWHVRFPQELAVGTGRIVMLKGTKILDGHRASSQEILRARQALPAAEIEAMDSTGDTP